MTYSELVHDFTTANDSNVKLAKACLSLAQLSPSLFTDICGLKYLKKYAEIQKFDI